jgi:23S rRNA pseudouridine2457 synthase
VLVVFNKPYGVLSQFTEEVPGQQTLAAFGFPPRIYPVGRLDSDSEGMLLLTDEAGLNTRLLDPRNSHWRRYLAQVEGSATPEHAARLAAGVVIQGKKTLPARAKIVEVDLPARTPPIRERKNIPTSWIELELREGRNRQVRKMTAAVGLPTLRLIRVAVGRWNLPPDLPPGSWREVEAEERALLFC